MVRVKLRSGKLWSFWGQSGCDTECGTLVTHADARAIVDRLPQMFEGVVIGPLEGRDG